MSFEPVIEQVEQKSLDKVRFTRRDFLRKSMWASAGALTLGGYGALIEPNHIVTKRLEIAIRDLPEALVGLRVAQISDIHFGDYLGESHVQEVVRRTNDLHADLVVITGDFVTSGGGRRTRHGAVTAEPCAKVLTGLHARFGTVSVLGNHDAASDPRFITSTLEAHGIRVLRNASMPIERDGARLWLAGVDDVLGRGARPELAFRGIPAAEPLLALVHEPDYADVISKYRVDLQLSGHSHGGQIRVPLLGAPILPELARRYPLGLYSVGNMKLYTNPGVGVIGLPIRFACPPEVTAFTLRNA